MKLTGARLDRFLKSPDTGVPLVLIYGPDGGLVRERAEGLVRAVVGDSRDPFRVAELRARDIAADGASLADEIGAMALTGGRRVVRIRDGADSVTAAIEALRALPAIESLLVVEAGELAPRSSLRKFFESATDGAAIACYSDGASDIEGLARAILAARDIRISRDAMAFLTAHLGSDREVSRRELEKLGDYMGGPGEVGLEDAAACIGDSAATSIDAVVMAAADGDHAGLETTLARVHDEGTSPVAILRAVGRHFQRLHFAGGLAAGGDILAAMAKLRPPVFFAHRDRFAAQARSWHGDAVVAALEWITEAEAECKSSGVPAAAVCHRLLMRLTATARRGRRR